MKRLKIKVFREKEGNPEIDRYYIRLIFEHERFSTWFESSEKLSKSEMNFRVIRLAHDLDAEIDGIVIAN